PAVRRKHRSALTKVQPWMRDVRVTALVSCLAAAAMLAGPASAQSPLSVEGTEFVLSLPAGRTLRSADLVGATLSIVAGGTPVEVTIKRVEDDSDALGGRVVLHHFVVMDAIGRQTDLCTPDAGGRSLGFPVADGRGEFELACTSGAVGKSVRWGYRPWEEQPGRPPKGLHQARAHMARAAYGGGRRSNTP